MDLSISSSANSHTQSNGRQNQRFPHPKQRSQDQQRQWRDWKIIISGNIKGCNALVLPLICTLTLWLLLEIFGAHPFVPLPPRKNTHAVNTWPPTESSRAVNPWPFTESSTRAVNPCPSTESSYQSQFKKDTHAVNPWPFPESSTRAVNTWLPSQFKNHKTLRQQRLRVSALEIVEGSDGGEEDVSLQLENQRSQEASISKCQEENRLHFRGNRGGSDRDEGEGEEVRQNGGIGNGSGRRHGGGGRGGGRDGGGGGRRGGGGGRDGGEGRGGGGDGGGGGRRGGGGGGDGGEGRGGGGDGGGGGGERRGGGGGGGRGGGGDEGGGGGRDGGEGGGGGGGGGEGGDGQEGDVEGSGGDMKKLRTTPKMLQLIAMSTIANTAQTFGSAVSLKVGGPTFLSKILLILVMAISLAGYLCSIIAILLMHERPRFSRVLVWTGCAATTMGFLILIVGFILEL